MRRFHIFPITAIAHRIACWAHNPKVVFWSPRLRIKDYIAHQSCISTISFVSPPVTVIPALRRSKNSSTTQVLTISTFAMGSPSTWTNASRSEALGGHTTSVKTSTREGCIVAALPSRAIAATTRALKRIDCAYAHCQATTHSSARAQEVRARMQTSTIKLNLEIQTTTSSSGTARRDNRSCVQNDHAQCVITTPDELRWRVPCRDAATMQ